jgi:peptidoglycan/LPS O-acetylase OafA/YrhL
VATSERKMRTAGLDGLRAVAALSVLCLHVWLYGQPNPDSPTRSGVLDKAVFEFRLGLVFFFVLSGYLLYRAFAAAALRRQETVDVGRYARRRVARILPAYYVALAGAFALLWGLRGSPGVRLPHGAQLPLFLVFGQNYSQATFFQLNPVTWTLCLEAAFYVALPFIGFAVYRLTRGRASGQAALLAGVAALGLGYSALDYAFGWSAMAGKALPAYLPVFAAGMGVALWAEARRLRDAPPLAPAASAALVIGGFGLAVADGVWHATERTPAGNPLISILGDAPAAIGFALVVAAAVAGRGPSVAWMRTRPLAWVGLVSYGVYLWHVPLLLFARGRGLLPSSFLLAFAVILPVVLLVSAGSWYLVERPLIALANRPGSRRSERRRRQTQLEAHAAP